MSPPDTPRSKPSEVPLAGSDDQALHGDAEVAGALGAVASSGDDLTLGALVQWAVAAPDEAVGRRLERLLAAWTANDPTPEEAGDLMNAAGGLAERFESSSEEALDQVFDVAASWLRRRGTRISPALHALASWPGFARHGPERFERLADSLTAEQARRSALEMARSGSAAIATLAAAPLGDDETVRLLMPPLVSLAFRETDHFTEAWGRAKPEATSRMLAAALAALGNARAEIVELEASSRGDEQAALASTVDAVLSALGDAEREAFGNAVLVDHFAALRRTLSSFEPLPAREPSERVRAWRVAARNRYPEVLDAPSEAGQILSLQGDPTRHVEAIVDLITELDRRVTSRRVLNEAERRDTRADLEAIADGVARAHMLGPGMELDAVVARQGVGELLLSRWSELDSRSEQELVPQLESLGDPGTARVAIRRVDALSLRRLDHGRLLSAAGQLTQAARDAAWKGVSAALRQRLKQRSGLSQSARGREVAAMQRVSEGIAPALRAVEAVLFGYFNFRALLDQAGWKPVDSPLGAIRTADQVDPEIHDVHGAGASERYAIRSIGVKVRGTVISRAVLEPLLKPDGDVGAAP